MEKNGAKIVHRRSRKQLKWIYYREKKPFREEILFIS